MVHKKWIRYSVAAIAVLLMVGVAEWLGEKEVIFPELMALTIGAWIIDKRVWRVKWWQTVMLMSLGAVIGVCIVRYSFCLFRLIWRWLLPLPVYAYFSAALL